jgi:Cytochrome P460
MFERTPLHLTCKQQEQESAMTRIPSSMIFIIAVMLAVFGGMAIAAQDRYTLKLGKLAFSDFRGYENWKDVAVSQTETMLKVIVANDVMMKAYRQGLPANGKFFPEGSKVVKIEWSFKKNPVSPYFVQVPDTLKAVATIEKDSKRFPDTHGWAWGNFNYDAASETFTPEGTDAKCGFAWHSTVAAQDYMFTAYPKR